MDDDKKLWSRVRLHIFVVRFAILLAFSTYFHGAERNWVLVRSNVQLQRAPYNPNIAEATKLAYTSCRFGFYWNIAGGMVAVFTPPPFSIVLAIVDLIIAIFFSKSSGMLSAHIPHGISGCEKGGAESWQVSNGSLSFFALGAKDNESEWTPFQVCDSFVKTWQYGIGMAVTFALISLVDILVCIVKCFSIVDSYQNPRAHLKRAATVAALSVPRIIIMLITLPLCVVVSIPSMLLRCLPVSVTFRVRYTGRWINKLAQRIRSHRRLPEDFELKVLTPNEADVRYQSNFDFKPTKLGDFLCYDILMLIVENLHFTDIINLSHTSKSVREAVLPSVDYKRRLSLYKRYSCRVGYSSECWVCLNQVCIDCRIFRPFKETILTRHLDRCYPCCDSCYMENVQRSNHWWMKFRTCNCTFGNPSSTFVKWIFQPNPMVISSYLHKIPRGLCEQCVRLETHQIQAARQRRTNFELKDVRRAVACLKCSKQLQNGPIWWVCSSCKLECTSSCHPSWTSRVGGGGMDEEQGTA